jgi:hypothetical protein
VEFTRRSFLAGLGGTLGYRFSRRAMASASVKPTAAASANIIQVRAKFKAIQRTLKFAGHTYECMVGRAS